MFSKNTASLIGNLTKDAETSFTTNNVSVTKFTVVTEHSFKKNGDWEKKKSYHSVVAFNLNQFALDYLKKGRKVSVDGRIEYNEYEKDGKKTYFTNIVLEKIVLLPSEKKEMAAAVDSEDDPISDTYNKMRFKLKRKSKIISPFVRSTSKTRFICIATFCLGVVLLRFT